MWYSTRFKLIASFVGVAFFVGAVSLIIGGQLLYQAVLNEARNRVRLDLNAAREIYSTRLKTIKSPLSIAAIEPAFHVALEQGRIEELQRRLDSLARFADLDFLGIAGTDGTTICRIGPPSPEKGGETTNPLARMVLERMVPIAGSVVLSREFLTAENPELADRARIRVIPTLKALEEPTREETSGLALAAAIPVIDKNGMLGVLYGGLLLNRNETIVDTVRDTVFQNEIYNGRNLGTATVFLNDLRISTNVLTSEGKRHIGTRVSEAVKKHVLERGKSWTDRAFVVNDWYITAYEPVEDVSGARVGMLYVGILEAKYNDIRRKALSVFIGITLAGMTLAVGLAYAMANKIMRPVDRLIEASHQVSEGNLSPNIGPIAKDEIGLLQKTFAKMLTSLEERDRRSRAESEHRLLQSEKQASVGRLAAGVAHEINNPLTGVLTYTYMLLRRKDLGDDIRSQLEIVATSTERVRKIVKGLLDFSRQTRLDRETTDINRLIRPTIALMENQALLKGVTITFSPGDRLPFLTIDRSQFQSVLLNMILNALDATDHGGRISVSTGISLSAGEQGRRGVEIAISDTGCGISNEDLDKLFDPFFTTKEVGKGTGLGLAVSFGIVQRHGGTIRVKSEVGKGSTFFICIPVEEQAEP